MTPANRSAVGFTAGPWEVRGSWCVMQCNTPRCVAECGEVHDSEANARLIASAPRLFALAERVAEFFEHTDAPLGIEARAALREAVGDGS